MHLDFVVPGFSKCGTTTLCSLLNEHPELFVPEVKEFNFFAWHWNKGWPWYRSHFNQSSKPYHGEGSQGYSSAEYAEISAQRMAEHYPDTRLIFVARNPVTRLASSFREMHQNGYKYGVNTPWDMLDALIELPNMIADTEYWKCISIFRKYFSDDQIQVFFFEDFTRDPAPVLRTCFEFLGVDPDFEVPNSRRSRNAAAEKCYDTPLMRAIRSVSLGRLTYRDVPIAWRRKFESSALLRKPFKGKPVLNDATRAYILDTVGEDSAKFLSFYGKPSSYWNLDELANLPAAA